MTDDNVDLTIDPAVLELFRLYLSQKFKMEVKTSDISSKAKKHGEEAPRFMIKPFKRGRGKHARIQFFTYYDRTPVESSNYTVKRNQGIDPADARDITGIEAKVLQELWAKGFRDVVGYRMHKDSLLLLKYAAGDTIEEHVNKKGEFQYEDMVTLIDSTLKIESAVGEIVKSDKNMKRYLTERKFKLLREGIGEEVSDSDLRNNFYTYRIIQGSGGMLPNPDNFKTLYAPNNQTLQNAPKMWISFDRPQNRVVVPWGDRLNNIRYDFNHIAEEHIGLELAMQLGALVGDYRTRETQTAVINLVNLVILQLYKKNLESKRWKSTSTVSTINKVDDKIAELRDSSAASKYVKVSEFYAYSDSHVLTDSACMAASFIHRCILDTFRAGKEYLGTGEESKKVKAYQNLTALRPICKLSASFFSRLAEDQRDYLNKKGYMLFTDHSLRTDYIAPALDTMLKGA